MAFIFSGALNPDKHSDIVIHRPEIDRILDHIAYKDEYVVLCNPRQTGKTTLLFDIQTRLKDDNYGVVYISLEGLDDLSKPEFYHTICSDIQDELSELIDAAPENDLSSVTNQGAIMGSEK